MFTSIWLIQSSNMRLVRSARINPITPQL
jgi:hypothetical protein